jgi:hypothetical protein
VRPTDRRASRGCSASADDDTAIFEGGRETKGVGEGGERRNEEPRRSVRLGSTLTRRSALAIAAAAAVSTSLALADDASAAAVEEVETTSSIPPTPFVRDPSFYGEWSYAQP